MENEQQSNYKDHIPKQFKLLEKVYDIEYISESVNEIVFLISRDKHILKRYVFQKTLEGYMNMIFFDNIVIRNFETFMFEQECERSGLVEDDKVNCYYKYFRKGRMI